ncbi:tetracycline resistance protein [Escherichia coli]|nr:tetracycline resistance protein [Escherichia coli]
MERMPGVMAVVAGQGGEEGQGQPQGPLAGVTSLTSIVGPILFTAIYAASITTWNGWAWIAGAALYLLCLPALRRGLWSGAGQRADR